MNLRVRPYHWEWENVTLDTGKKATIIRAWCLDENNEPILLRIEKYAIPFHIVFDAGQNINWSDKLVGLFYKALADELGQKGFSVIPFRESFFEPLKPLYGLNVPNDLEADPEELLRMIQEEEVGPEPSIVLKASSIQAAYVIERILKNKVHVRHAARNYDIGAKLYMKSISAVDKLLTSVGYSHPRSNGELRPLGHCEWIDCVGTPINAKYHVSTLKQEYLVEVSSIVPVDDEIAKTLSTNPKVFSFDIECYTPNHNKFPNLWDVRCPIKTISCAISRTDGTDIRTWSLVTGHCPPSDNPNSTIICCDDEIDMIYAMCNLIREEDPELITGFNIAFDLEYIDARLGGAGENWPAIGRLKGKPMSIKIETWNSSAYRNMKIAHLMGMNGRICIDVFLEVYRNYKFPLYNLNYVANHFLGSGKVPLSYKEMFRLFEVHEVGLKYPEDSPEYKDAIEAIERIVEYNDEDAVLCIKLFPRLKIWINSIEQANIMCVNIYDLNTRGQQERCVQMLYRECILNGYYMNWMPGISVFFKGGKVQCPEYGCYILMLYIDFNSLYPSIIIAHNVCYTTILDRALADRLPPHSYHRRLIKANEDELEDDDVDDDESFMDDPTSEPYSRSKQTLLEGDLEIFFIKEEYREGLLPKMCKRLVVKRKLVQAEMRACKDPSYKDVLDKRQNALKTATNSIYGFTGANRFPLKQASIAVTAWGRDYITQTSKFLKGNGAFQIYGDTDSLMFQLLSLADTSAKCKAVNIDICNQITDLFPPAIIMKRELEGCMFAIGKKKYVIWLYDDNGFYKFQLEYNEVAENVTNLIFVDFRDAFGIDDDNEELRAKVYECVLDFVSQLTPGIKICQGVLAKAISLIFSEYHKEQIDINWKQCDIHVARYIEKLEKGILSARRDNCAWVATTYDKIVLYICCGASFYECMICLAENVRFMIEGGVNYKEFLVNGSVNSEYKQAHNFMKVFADNMRALGKHIEAGERLYYLVIDNGGTHLGDRMVLEDLYIESLSTDTPYKIDYIYYLDKTASVQIDNVLFAGYCDTLIKAQSRFNYKTGRSTVSIVTPMKLINTMLAKGKTIDDFIDLVDEKRDLID